MHTKRRVYWWPCSSSSLAYLWCIPATHYKIDTLTHFPASFGTHTHKCWMTAALHKFIVHVQCIPKLLKCNILIKAAPPPQHYQNDCFYFHWEIKHLLLHYVTLSAKTKWKKGHWCVFQTQRGDYSLPCYWTILPQLNGFPTSLNALAAC